MKGLTSKTLAANLKRLREEVHMEQSVVARVLRVPRSAISNIESGRRAVTAMEAVELCKLYRISPNDLFRWKHEDLWDLAREINQTERGKRK